jgi:hypothetical protein
LLALEEWVAATQRLKSARKNRELTALGGSSELSLLYSAQRTTRASARKIERGSVLPPPAAVVSVAATPAPKRATRGGTTRKSERVKKKKNTNLIIK